MRPFGFAVAVLAVLTAGCAGYGSETEEIRGLYRSHQFAAALALLEQSSLKDSTRNRLLYHLEKASIYDKMGEQAKAQKLLLNADRIVDKLYTESVSRAAASFVINDSVVPYEGEDFEKVLIHQLLALSFLESGNLKSAGVSARRINSKLYQINQRYSGKKNAYSNDAFALYLSGMIFEALKQYDDAIIDYKKSLKLYHGDYGRFGGGKPPGSLFDALFRLATKRGRKDVKAVLKDLDPSRYKRVAAESSIRNAGDLVVIHQHGNIPVKYNKEFLITISGQLVRFSFPAVRRRTYRSSWERGTGIEVSRRGAGKKLFSGETAQDLGAIAYQTLEDRRGRMILKAGARLLAKGQMTDLARRELGPLAGLAANIFSAVTETGDTRSWTLLPEGFSVSRAQLPAGTYQISIKSNGRVRDLRSVTVRPGQILFLRDQ